MSTKKKIAPRTKSYATKRPRVLDEQTSARVIAQYLNIERVQVEELDVLTGDNPQPQRALTDREIALSFRVSEILQIPDLFAISPRFKLAFERARAALAVMTRAHTERAA